MASAPRIAILGGGISGLSAAWELSRRLPEAAIELLESSDRLGGVLRTTHRNGFTIEHSADMFTIDPNPAWELCRQLDLEEELLTTRPTTHRAWVAGPDRIHPIPRGFSLMLPTDIDAVLASPLLSDQGKARFLEEEQVPPGPADEDQSLAEFVIRRFGRELFQRLVQPLVSGIYTGDPDRLSMRATMQRFVDLEQEHGSLIAAARAGATGTSHRQSDAQTSGARYGLFRAPRQGIGQIVDRLVEELSGVTVRLETEAESIERDADGRWLITWRSSESKDAGSTAYDAVIVTTPARLTAGLIQPAAPALAAQLAQIEAVSAAIAVLSLPRGDNGQPFDGYGIIIPAYLRRKMIACSFTSNKFESRAPEDQMLVRCFVGGALQPDLVDLDDEALFQIVIEELAQLIDLPAPPQKLDLIRWRECMPQYTVGHLPRLAAIDAELEKLPGLFLAGNSYRGVGIPACIGSGQSAAREVVTMLAGSRLGPPTAPPDE